MKKSESDSRFSLSFKVGAIALVCLIIGFQTALFVRQAAVSAVAAHRDRPDTVYVVDSALAAELLHGAGFTEMGGGAPFDYSGAPSDYSGPPTVNGGTGAGRAPERAGVITGAAYGNRMGVVIRRESQHTPMAKAMAPRRAESFRFNPNTVSVEDLVRLGFSRRQAESIDAYRQKGGRYRRPSDFAKSYVVADSVYERLRPFIDIPRLDINAADSAAFDDLPGIGPYFAARMVQMRSRLHGYSFPEQLMDIYNFDEERYNALSDLITVGPAPAYQLWTLPEDSLAMHPYIGRQSAHGVLIYRQNTPPERRSVLDLKSVLRPGMAEKLSRCRIE